MSYIGICEYVIGVLHEYGGDYWYYTGNKDITNYYSTALADAKRYDDLELLRDDLETLPKTYSYRIYEIQRCPKCHKEFTEYPAISREDNETEICPECGIREAVEAFERSKNDN